MPRRARLTSLSALLLAACQGEIPVVGSDAEGKMIETMLAKRAFVDKLTSMTDDLAQSVVPVADSDTYGRKLSGLRGIRIGLGVKGSVGLDEYWKLGGNLGFHLHFANKE